MQVEFVETQELFLEAKVEPVSDSIIFFQENEVALRVDNDVILDTPDEI